LLGFWLFLLWADCSEEAFEMLTGSFLQPMKKKVNKERKRKKMCAVAAFLFFVTGNADPAFLLNTDIVMDFGCENCQI
jgi:hypothetical protein